MPSLIAVERTAHRPRLATAPPGIGRRDLLSLHDLSPSETESLLNLGREVKADPDGYAHALEGMELAMIFERPSLRTRISFEFAMMETGGRCITLGPQEVSLGNREAVKEAAVNLSRWVDVVMARLFSHGSLREIAANAAVPVINGGSDFEHPCQVLGDYLTVLEHKDRLAGLTLAFIGDGNNVAHSLIYGATRLGVRIKVATPPGHEPSAAVVAEARFEGGDVYLTDDPAEAVEGADVIYTDVLGGTGQDAGSEELALLFRPYQVNMDLMRKAKPDTLFMHCHPARRAQEVTDDVIASVNSIVHDQAENRLHIQKAILLTLLA